MTARGVHVLVVDDNSDDIELFRLSFARASPGCTVTGASSTRAAGTMLLEGGLRPDLVLLDWKMPGMRGPDLLRTLRADARTVGLPVLVFSSSDDPTDQRDAYGAGATAWLVKPPGLAEYESLARDIHAFWSRAVRPPG